MKLGGQIFVAAAKDVKINEANCRINGLLDDRFTMPGPGEPALNLGGHYVLNNFPDEAPWNFVAVGRGHDAAYWAQFLSAIDRVDTSIAVNIEHEDTELGQLEGLTSAASTLLAARDLATTWVN